MDSALGLLHFTRRSPAGLLRFAQCSPMGGASKKKSLMLRISFFYSGLRAKASFALPEIKKPGYCPAFSSLAVRGVLEP